MGGQGWVLDDRMRPGKEGPGSRRKWMPWTNSIPLMMLWLASAGSSPAFAKNVGKATAEEVAASYQKLIEIQAELDSTVDDLVAKKDWKGLSALLNKPQYTGVEETLLKLVRIPPPLLLSLSWKDKETDAGQQHTRRMPGNIHLSLPRACSS